MNVRLLRKPFKQDSSATNGDSHNFGASVFLNSEGLYEKPRSVFWEKLLLSESGFRRFVVNLFERHRLADPFATLPKLKYVDSDNLRGGKVAPLKVTPIRDLSLENLNAVGRFSALMAFLGVNDLLAENLFIGKDESSRFICSPIDVESIFNKLNLLSQTHLVVHGTAPHSDYGLYPLLQAIEVRKMSLCLATLCKGYIQTLEFLFSHSTEIFKYILKETRVYQTPIRVLLRETVAYADFLAHEASESSLSPSLTKCEREQLSRKDIPYYFRFIRNPNIYYYAHPNRKKASEEVRAQMGKFQTSDFLDLSSSSSLEFSNEMLMQGGVLQIVRSSPVRLPVGKVVCDDLELKISRSTINIKWKNEFEVSTKW